MTDGELQMAAEVPEDSKAAEVTTFENIFGKLMISEQKWLDLCTGNGQSQDISYLSKIVCFRANQPGSGRNESLACTRVIEKKS